MLSGFARDLWLAYLLRIFAVENTLCQDRKSPEFASTSPACSLRSGKLRSPTLVAVLVVQIWPLPAVRMAKEPQPKTPRDDPKTTIESPSQPASNIAKMPERNPRD